jgi:RNA polymerase sigma factor (sigma-70 family)
MTDQDILFKLRNDSSYFSKIYNDYKSHSLNFMRKMNNDFDLLKDIYQDAVIVLYEKSKDPDFKLTCSIQTYINSICRNQLLNKYKENSRFISKVDDFDPNVNDWFEEFDEEKETRLSSIESALEILKEKGEKCFEILKRFFYQKQSMVEIAVELNYTNGDNVKNQKSRCQKKLKEIVLENYESI